MEWKDAISMDVYSLIKLSGDARAKDSFEAF